MSKKNKSVANATLESLFKGCSFVGENFVDQSASITGCVIENSQIFSGAVLVNSVVKNSVIQKGASVGPFAQVRETSVIGENARVGNFVEVKNSIIGDRTKISHLAYVGDCDVGTDCNLGAGTVICNYDGIKKHRSKIGRCVFIGSNSTLISPLEIGENAFVCAGSTITKNVAAGECVIGRARSEVIKIKNKYLENFQIKNKFFGTDGIRGVWGELIKPELARKVARSLCFRKTPKVVLGMDTRPASAELRKIFCDEITKHGGEVLDLGKVPTACVAFYVRDKKCDYGVMLTASHNPKEFCGIKIFGPNGIKLSEQEENELEQLFEIKNLKKLDGKLVVLEGRKNKYFTLLKDIFKKTLDMKVVLDCANGSASKFAPLLFKSLGCEVISLNLRGEINENCGALHPNVISNAVVKHKADIGFSFDGDADRVVVATSEGKILNGDEILFILAWFFKKNNLLKENKVVGTIMTNLGIENKLKAMGIDLVRTSVGDKFIIEKMLEEKLSLGAEQSGHVILGDILPSGDGLLTARVLCEIFSQNKRIFQTVKENRYVQVHKNIKITSNELREYINTDEFQKKLGFFENKLKNGRIIVRPSGTENVIRILVEADNKNKANLIAAQLKIELSHH